MKIQTFVVGKIVKKQWENNSVNDKIVFDGFWAKTLLTNCSRSMFAKKYYRGPTPFLKVRVDISVKIKTIVGKKSLKSNGKIMRLMTRLFLGQKLVDKLQPRHVCKKRL